jgi:polyisoprenoid-binding protein YceI
MIKRSLLLAMAFRASLDQSFAASGWTLEPAASKLTFEVTQAGGEVKGEFRSFNADIAFDRNDLPASKVHVVVDIVSVTTGAVDRDQELPKPDWFDAARFPKAVFDADRFEAVDDKHFVANGSLALRDLKQAVSLPFALDIQGDTAMMDGRLELDRNAFGVGQGAWAGSDIVGRKVAVIIHVQARRKP